MWIEFSKMHGLGNDFVVLDLVTQRLTLDADLIRRLSDRHFGIGFDQLLIVEPPQQPDVDFQYRIFNADGSEVEQCGNGVRCFARFVHERRLTRKRHLRVSTKSGIVEPEINDQGWVRVNMGKPRLNATEIPSLAKETRPDGRYQLTLDALPTQPTVEFGMVNMGNPHAVLLVPDIETAPVAEQGKLLESHAFFPERVNVGFMQVMSPQEIRLRVFERGAGETLACGTGACAAVVSGIQRGLLKADSDIQVHLPGGPLSIRWRPNDVVWMTGPTASVFQGSFRLSDFC